MRNRQTRAGRSSSQRVVALAAVLGLVPLVLVSEVALARPASADTASNYRAAVLADSPLSYWRLGEGTGATTAADEQGLQAGILEGGVTPGVDPSPFAGRTAMHFDGANCTGVNVSSAVPHYQPSSAVSVEAWVKPSYSGPGIVFRERGFGYQLEAGQGEVGIGGWVGSPHHGGGVSDSVPQLDGAWHHVVGQYTGAGWQTWVDGISNPLVADSGSLFYGGTEAAIGRDGLACGGLLPSFGGDLAEVAVYDHALSPARIEAHLAAGGYNVGPGGPAGTLGPQNPSSNHPPACAGDPVNCATGNFWESYNDIGIPGRGSPLNLVRTYNSLAVAQSGPFGPGWASSYDSHLSVAGDGSVTVTQETGATVPFYPASAGGFGAPSWVLATLVHNADGTYTFARRRRDIFTFDSSGRLIGETDLNGAGASTPYTTTLAYDGSGRLSTVTDPAGPTLTFAYGTNGLVSSVTDSASRSVTYGYDSSLNLTSATDVAGSVTHYGYDGGHHLTTIVDPRGNTVLTNTYDSSGRATQQVDGLSRTTTFAYGTNASGSATTTITDPSSRVMLETFDNALLLIQRIRAYGTSLAATTSYTYDPATQGTASVTDPNGHVTNATYDAAGNQLTSTDGLGRQTVATYDSLNDQLTVIDPKGVTTTRTFDARGNLTVSSTPLLNAAGTSTIATRTTSYAHTDAAHPGDVT